MVYFDTETLRERYSKERPLYEKFAGYIQELLESKIRQQGIACTIQARAKEIDSFLKKALRKKYTSPFDEIRDKAGVRVIFTYHDNLNDMEEIIKQHFTVHKHENKKLSLDYDQLGYLGIHFEVSLLDALLKPEQQMYREMICEIQLHTHAQNLWANISHEFIYKPSQSPPDEIKRNLYRLVALVEIFDNEVRNAKHVMSTLVSSQEVEILNQLEKQFYHFITRPFDRELSLEIITKLQRLFEPSEISDFSTLLKRFVSKNEEKINEIFKDYSNDKRCNPLLFQPESLLIFERLEKDKFCLKEVWMQALPLPLLESLATIWGTTV